ncbi:hypothetical protein B0H66DRAFT_596060 [Apodospora peruviana]|uniref:F-box domain-containing protein n=1 Tax=Apodospora peruviana TaxID=516989 RepID=A0AAE0HTA8_9PEZI|nr:hypothetical protein B0H66DRAFT_596060 [Apodospora peruviana]
MPDQTSTSATVRLPRLPPEIWNHVCFFLGRSDLISFRCACKAFADIGIPFALPKIVVYLHQSDFEHLRAIADHPVKAKYVKSITYIPHTLRSPKPSFPSYLESYKHNVSADHWLDDLPPESAHRQTSILTSSAYLQQEDILSNDLDFAMFADTLPRFTGLEYVKVSNEYLEREASNISWKFIEQLPLLNIFSNLTSIALNFDTAVEDGSPERERSATDVAECREVLQGGPLREFLAALPNLKILSIGSHIQPGHKWPKLVLLRLYTMEITKKGWLDVLDLHKDTLAVVELHDIKLEESWLVLLPEMGELLDLDGALISGALHGRNEEGEEEQAYWSLGMPGMSREEDCIDMQERLSMCLNLWRPLSAGCLQHGQLRHGYLAGYL